MAGEKGYTPTATFAHYQNTAGYPDVANSHEEKLKEEYGLAWGKAISDDWFGGGSIATITNSASSFFRQRFAAIQENRAFASGLQRPDIYQQWLNETGDESYLALDWSNMSVIPKYVKLIVDFIDKLPANVSIEATDELSLTRKEEYKNQLLERLMSKDLIDEAKEAFGAQFSEYDFVPEDMEDLEMHLKISFKQSIEVAFEQIVSGVFSLNEYNAETKKLVIQDIIENSLAAVRVYSTPDKGVQVDFVDIAYFIHSPSKYPDFRDGFYAGELVPKSVYELKKETGGKWSDEKWKQVAEKFSGRQFTGNSDDSRYNRSPYVSGYVHDYDKAFLDVLHFEIKVPNRKVMEKKESKYGNTDVFDKKSDYKLPKNSKYKRELIEHDYYTCYNGKYIIGTDMIYDWEQSTNVATKQGDPQEAMLSYRAYLPHGYKGQYRSIVDSMKPAANQMMLAWLKMQQVVAQAKPTSVAISIDALNNLDLGGGEKIDFGEAIDIYEATGRLYFKSRNSEGEWISGGQPISPLPNEIKNLQELMATYNFALDQIRTITGITREMEGIIGNRQAAKTVESSINSSSSAISDVAHAFGSITRRAAETICSLIQDIPTDHPLHKMYADIVGASDMAIVDAMEGKSLHTFGITVDIDTDLQKRVQLNQDISIALEQKTIELEDKIDILDIADKGQLSTASKLLAQRRRKRMKEAEQREAAAQQRQMMMNERSAQVKGEQDRMTMQAELMAYQKKAEIDLVKELQIINAKGEVDLKKSVQKFRESLALGNQKKINDAEADMRSHQMDKELMTQQNMQNSGAK